MAQTSFEIDAKTAAALDGLKEIYGVTTNAAVIKRALAIALVAAKKADEDNNIHLLVTDKTTGEKTEVLLPQSF